MTLTDAENEQLAEFVLRVRQVWTDRGPEGRRELQRRFEEAVGGMFSDFIWHARYDELAERYDRAIDHAAGTARHALARVSRLEHSARLARRKTIKADDLTIALSKCEFCEFRDATRLFRRRPICDEDFAHFTNSGSP